MRTDGEAEPYFYDEASGFWLSVRSIDFQFGLPAAASGPVLLDMPGGGKCVEGATDYGYRADHDLLVQSVGFTSDANAATNYNIALRVNGSPVPVGVVHTTLISDGYTSGFTYEVSEGDIVGLRATNNVPGKLTAIVRCRRRLSAS